MKKHSACPDERVTGFFELSPPSNRVCTGVVQCHVRSNVRFAVFCSVPTYYIEVPISMYNFPVHNAARAGQKCKYLKVYLCVYHNII